MLYVCVYERVCVCACEYVYMCVRVCMCVCVYVGVYVCVFKYNNVHIPKRTLSNSDCN